MKISVLIPARWTQSELPLTLYRLKDALRKFETEFLLVGNVYPGRAYEVLKEYNELGLRFVEENTPGGWPARRTGLAHVTGDIIINADAHIYPLDNCVELLINELVNGQADMVFPLLGRSGFYHSKNFYKAYHDDDDQLWSFMGRLGGLPASVSRGDRLYFVPTFGWALVAFRRRDYERLGGMPQYFMGQNGGEMYLGLKYWMNDLKVAIQPQAKNIHTHWGGRRSVGSRNVLTASYALGGMEAMKKTEAVLREKTTWEIDADVASVPQNVTVEKHPHTLEEIITTKPWRVLNEQA